MAMGKTADLPTNAGHPFFERLNRVLEEAGFDAFVEGLCAAFYAARMGRPSLRPGRYFRLLFIGYFEGLSSERGIAWRVADSLSLRSFTVFPSVVHRLFRRVVLRAGDRVAGGRFAESAVVSGPARDRDSAAEGTDPPARGHRGGAGLRRPAQQPRHRSGA